MSDKKKALLSPGEQKNYVDVKVDLANQKVDELKNAYYGMIENQLELEGNLDEAVVKTE